MKWLLPFPKEHNLYFLTPRKPDFEDAYLTARTLEDRLYTDETVRSLPYLDSSHPQATEWALRQANTQRLLAQLSQLPTSASILDLGCGNGWFSQRIASTTTAQVLGADINEQELLQAARLFNSPNCHFAYGDIFANVWPETSFETIVLNSCIQYFPDLSKLVSRLQLLLCPGGVIHILDSPIYQQTAIAAAQNRTRVYYQKQGVNDMAHHYHHHCWEDLEAFNYKVIYNPSSFGNQLKRKFFQTGSPFPWLMISQ